MMINLKNRKYEDIKDYDAIYIGGGNTYYLLNEIKSSHFDKLLKKYLKNGGLIYGGSAGTIIFGMNIQTASIGNCSDTNHVKLKKFNGLNLVNNYSIHCHYRKSDDCELFKYVKKHHNKVIALTKETGILIKDKKISVIGSKKAFVFGKKKKIILETQLKDFVFNYS